MSCSTSYTTTTWWADVRGTWQLPQMLHTLWWPYFYRIKLKFTKIYQFVGRYNYTVINVYLCIQVFVLNNLKKKWLPAHLTNQPFWRNATVHPFLVNSCFRKTPTPSNFYQKSSPFYQSILRFISNMLSTCGYTFYFVSRFLLFLFLTQQFLLLYEECGSLRPGFLFCPVLSILRNVIKLEIKLRTSEKMQSCKVM